MPQYIPLTNNCDLPCLAIDSHAPLADLHNNALLRIRVATELLESFARNEMGVYAGTPEYAVHYIFWDMRSPRI